MHYLFSFDNDDRRKRRRLNMWRHKEDEAEDTENEKDDKVEAYQEWGRRLNNYSNKQRK